MRMWMIDPKLMCRRHLLGEHRELHALIGILRKGTSIQGYLDKNLIEVYNIPNRHEEIVKEMRIRGYRHKSPLKINFPLPHLGKVYPDESIQELKIRCPECRKKIETYYQ